MTTASYSTAEACRLAGCTYRQADYWDRTEIVRPSIHAARGSGGGRQRAYSAEDVVRLKVVVMLLGAGLSLQRVRGFVNGDCEVLDRWEFDRAVELLNDIREPVPA